MESIKNEIDFEIKKRIRGNVLSNYSGSHDAINFGADCGIRASIKYKLWSNVTNNIGWPITRGFNENKFNQ